MQQRCFSAGYSVIGCAHLPGGYLPLAHCSHSATPASRLQACRSCWSSATTTCSVAWPPWPPMAAATRMPWQVRLEGGQFGKRDARQGWLVQICLGVGACLMACNQLIPIAAGKDVLQRVGSKGSVAELTRVLVARLTPALLPPEVLRAAMEEAEGSQEGVQVERENKGMCCKAHEVWHACLPCPLAGRSQLITMLCPLAWPCSPAPADRRRGRSAAAVGTGGHPTCWLKEAMVCQASRTGWSATFSRPQSRFPTATPPHPMLSAEHGSGGRLV